MGFKKVKDHTGRTRIELSKYWPDRTRYRRYVPNPTVAKKVTARIDEAIAMGTWRELKEELSRNGGDDPKIADFAEVYFKEYCCVRNSRPDFKEHAIKPIVRLLGSVSLKTLKRKHAHEFTEKLLNDVEPATVNRSLAVLKNMLGFAVDKEYLAANPLARFKLLPEEQRPTRILSLEEYWRLIECHDDPVAAAYATVLGETAIRKSEGIRLTWSFIDFHQRLLTVERSKNRKPRYIPLSEFALQALASLQRLDGCPSVFVRLDDGTPWHSFQGPFNRAKEKAGLEWVGFHDLRHFRASQWVMQGVDIRTVQELLGHQSITTTMRYAHYAPQHATQSIREVQRREAERFVLAQEKNRRKEETPIEAIRPALLTCSFQNAEKRTRTSTPLRGLEPESSASANSAISAKGIKSMFFDC